MPESIFTENLKKGGTMDRMLTKMEFAFRYEVYQNIAMEDLVNPDRHTDLFKTQAFTAGVNYYLEGRGVKLQANYIVVVDPTSPGQPLRGLRKVQNDVFVVNFQSSF
jgi:phosphate-selective porin